MTSKTFAQIHFTGEGFRTLGIYRLFFKDTLARALKVRADYDAEVADWYENGDGRPERWVAVIECGNCGTRLGESPEPFDPCVWADDSCPEGGNHEPGFRRVNVGGKGHTFPQCIHGSSLWTDYDNICGGCEDGWSAIQEAIIDARTRFLTFVGEWEWANAAPASVPHETRQALIVAACEKFPAFTNPGRIVGQTAQEG